MASYDPRWGDDPRDPDENSRDMSQGSRGGTDPRERERVDPRDVFMNHVSLPRGREREHVHSHGCDYTLRGSETSTLTTVGAFRAVPAHELRDTFDRPSSHATESCGTFATQGSCKLFASTATRRWSP